MKAIEFQENKIIYMYMYTHYFQSEKQVWYLFCASLFWKVTIPANELTFIFKMET